MKIIMCLLLGCAAVASAAEKPVVQSVYEHTAATLTTDPNTAFWRAARPVVAEAGNDGTREPEYRTEIRSRWTSTDIYFLFVCPYKQLYLKPSPDVQNETYELWNWNVAEVFIGSDFSNIRRYKEFEVSPHNEWVDLDIDLDAPHHEDGWKWNSGFEHTTHIDEQNHVWYAALKIPLKAIDSRPARAGNTFRVNFYRTEAGPKDTKEIMWQPVMGKSFHAPEHFGLLRLVSK